MDENQPIKLLKFNNHITNNNNVALILIIDKYTTNTREKRFQRQTTKKNKGLK